MDTAFNGATFNELADLIHDNAAAHGWWGDVSDYRGRGSQRNFPEVLALIHSEVSEALEAYRDGHEPAEQYWRFRNDELRNSPEDEERNPGKPEGVPSEFADIIIRVLDACAAWDIDIDEAIKIKMKYNETRPYLHGRKR